MNSEKGFWVLSQLGKKVLRPGGKELTEKIIDFLHIQNKDSLVEFAPGKGFTTQLLLDKNPNDYYGIDIDSATIAELKHKFPQSYCHFIQGSASQTGLLENTADIVVGEAMLTMHADHRKLEIIAEAFRILKPDGAYAIHELGLTPDDVNDTTKKEILVNLSKAGKVNARPLTSTEWVSLLQSKGFVVRKVMQSPMRLLEFRRLIADEGWLGWLGMVFRLLTKPHLRASVIGMKHAFQKYAPHLIAIAIIVQKPTNQEH